MNSICLVGDTCLIDGLRDIGACLEAACASNTLPL